MTKKRYRSLKQIREDGLWPTQGGIMGPDSERSARHYAIMEVLRIIPTDDYDKLNENRFQWFIPHYWMYGTVMPFYINTDDPGTGKHPKVLYLSPRLEKAAWDIVVATVAQELAHLALGMADSQAQEEEAFLKLCEWGLEREAKKLRALNKWRDSYERYVVRKLKEQLFESV